MGPVGEMGPPGPNGLKVILETLIETVDLCCYLFIFIFLDCPLN